MNALSVLKDHFMTICLGMIVFLSSFLAGLVVCNFLRRSGFLFLAVFFFFFLMKGRDKFCYQIK